MELEENKQTEQEKVKENEEPEKIEEKKENEEKIKKKIIKRTPMEKTVDDTIKEFDKLMEHEVSIFLNLYCSPLILINLKIYLKNLKKKRKKKKYFTYL